MNTKQTVINEFNRLAERFSDIVLDNEQRPMFLFRCVLIALGSVSLVMTVVNRITNFPVVMTETLFFAILCAINTALTYCGQKGYKAAERLFKVEIIALFSFFLISGDPQGFSPFWAPLLPACGLLLFGMLDGVLTNAVMLAIIVFFCWTPWGRDLLMYEYQPQFLLRFPLLFTGYWAVGLLLSFILSSTQRGYYSLSTHDRLTGAFNRMGFADIIKESNDSFETEGFMILDLDFFKKVNDTYGHFVGDEMLCYAMNVISESCPVAYVCRWGGEEFAVYVRNGSKTEELSRKIVETMDMANFISRDGIKIHQTISCGAVEAPTGKYKIDRLGIEADHRLYEAKNTGRNKAVFDKMD